MSKPFRNKKKGHFRFGLAMLGMLSSNLFIPGCAGDKVLPSKISNGFERIAQHKSKAEQSALTIKTNWSSGSKQYKEGEALYDDAKAAFDVWIERLRFDLVLDNDVQRSEHYTKSLHETAKKSEALVSYATKASAKPLTVEPIGMIGALSDAGMRIWKEYSAVQKERRDEITLVQNRFGQTLSWTAYDTSQGVRRLTQSPRKATDRLSEQVLTIRTGSGGEPRNLDSIFLGLGA